MDRETGRIVMSRTRLLGTVLAATLAAGTLAAAPAAASGHRSWVGTWEAAPAAATSVSCTDCTIRDVVHTSIGGRSLRVRISNTFGTAPLQLGHATVALPDAPGSAGVATGTLHGLRFGGQQSVSIPAGASVLSDPLGMAVPAGQDLLVTTYTPGLPALTYHPLAQQNTYYAPGGDRSTDTSAADFGVLGTSWYLVSGVEVAGGTPPGAVVAFGDSITDGACTTVGADTRWPDVLAARLRDLPLDQQRGVLNAGISGNRILLDSSQGNDFGPSGLSRFDRDVIDQPAGRTVIIMLGINDIQQTPHQYDPSAIIAGLTQMADQAHAAGLRVFGATITPYEGWTSYEQAGEDTREAVNDWIRTTPDYDGVIDFDALLRDPADPHRMLTTYDCGDHLHPNDTGYQAMGGAVDLSQL
jgi:lysophospholipase L1-like esterase